MKQNKITFSVGIILILIALPLGFILQKAVYKEAIQATKAEFIKHKEIKTTTSLETELKDLVLSLGAGLLFSAKTISQLVGIFVTLFCLVVGVFLILIWRIKRRLTLEH